jgi:hypothetical protein
MAISTQLSKSTACASIQISKKISIGGKRNLAAVHVPSAWIMTMDDDDISLPERIQKHFKVSTTIGPTLQGLGKDGIYHRSGIVFVAVENAENIVGQR